MISPRMSEMIARALEPIEEEIIPTTATTIYGHHVIRTLTK